MLSESLLDYDSMLLERVVITRCEAVAITGAQDKTRVDVVVKVSSKGSFETLPRLLRSTSGNEKEQAKLLIQRDINIKFRPNLLARFRLLLLASNARA